MADLPDPADLITDEMFDAFEVAFDQQTWPSGGRVWPLSRRQMAAVRAALNASGLRGRLVAAALEELAVDLDKVDTEDCLALVDRADLRRVAAEYRAGER